MTGDPPGAGRGAAAVPLRRNREFTLLWSGQALSGLGSQISTVAYPLLALAVTGSAADAGIVGFARGLPAALLALPAGAVADRVDRRALMVGCDGVRALALAALAVAAATGSAAFALIVAVAVIDGGGATVTAVIERGVLRRLVAPEQLSDAVSLNESRIFGTALAGPLLGGLLFGLGRAIPFALDAVSYAASTASKLAIRTRFQEDAGDGAPGGGWEGMRWIWRRPFFRGVGLLWAASNPVISGLLLLVVVIAKHHHASPALVGVMLAIGAGGGVLGAIAAPALQRRLSPSLVVVGENWVLAAAIAAMLLTASPLLLGVILAAATAVLPVSNSIVVSHRVALAPDRLQGRVTAAFTVISLSFGWVGPLAVGYLDSAGDQITIAALAGAMLAIAVAATLAPSLRHPPSAATQGGGGES